MYSKYSQVHCPAQVDANTTFNYIFLNPQNRNKKNSASAKFVGELASARAVGHGAAQLSITR